MEKTDPFGIIYKITNLVNGKIYIGQTIRTLKERWWNHCSERSTSNMIVGHAIRKYGKENFAIEEIDVAFSKNELDEKEAFYINALNTTNNEIGYNIEKFPMGLGEVSEATRLKMSEAQKHYLTTDKGKLALKNRSNKYRGQKPTISTSSVFVGVSRSVKNKTLKSYNYQAGITLNGKRLALGTFETEEEAARAYDIKALELFGNDCKLNFPELRTLYIKNKITPKRNSVKSNDLPKFITWDSKQLKFRVQKKGHKPKPRFKLLEDAVKYLENIP